MINKSLIPLSIVVLASGCVPQLEERIRNKKEKATPPAVTETEVTAAELQPGVTQGTIPANQRATMRSGGSSIIVEPGTFAVDVPVTMEEGDPLTGEAASVGVNSGDVAAQGAPLVVTAPEGTAPTQPFTIAMPIPGAGLALVDDQKARLVVLFKVTIPGTGQVVLGVLSGDKLTLDGNNVKFLATRFGSYQVVVLTKAAPPPVEVASATPIKRKRDQPAPAPSGPAPIVPPTVTLVQDAAVGSAKGTTGEATVTLTNGATAAKGLEIRVAGDAWSIKEDGCSGNSLAAGGTCKVVLYFTPSAIGKNAGRLFVLHPAAGDKELVSLALDGSGLVAPTLTATVTPPSGVAFRATAKVRVTVTNGGQVTSGRVFAKLASAFFSLPGSVAADALQPALGSEVCQGLAAGASCSFDVDFVSPGEGNYLAVLELAAVGAGKTSVQLDVLGTTLDTLSVGPAYPTTKWMDFLARDSAQPLWLQPIPIVACADESVAPGECFHAGEILRANLPGFADCAGIEVRDTLDAFQWICHDFGTTIAAFSTGLKPGKGLRHLVNASSWKANSLEVKASGVRVLRSPVSSSWIGNSVAEAAANATPGDQMEVLGASGRIWTVAAARATEGYHFTAGSQALVTLGDAVLRAASSSNNVSTNATRPGSDTCALLSGNGQPFLWIEATLDGLGLCDRGVFLKETNRLTIRGTNVASTTNAGVAVGAAFGVKITDTRVAHTDMGIILDEIEGSVVHRVNVSNSEIGLRFGGGAHHVVTSSLFAANNEGIALTNVGGPAAKITLNRVTFAHQQYKGLYLGPLVAGVDAVGLLANGNSGAGVYAGGSILNLVSSVRVVDYYGFGNGGDINSNYAMINVSGQFLHGGSCPASNASLNINANCGYLSGDTASASRAGTGAYVGIVGGDDRNASDAGGIGSPGAGFDWLSFDNFWRVWIRGNLSGGACSSGTCKIHDFSLAAGATPARNHTPEYPTGHARFVPGAACPAAAAPSRNMFDSQTPLTNQFLINAIEQFGDGRGDDDGLCEAGERCIYAPAFGAYQGSGGLTAPCVADAPGDGTVDDVVLQAYESE